jgi:Protein of unknown function (DUF1761)
MNLLPPVVAGLAYFALGGLWFTPLFGRHWDLAVGFARPPKWRPSAAYYLGPLAGCIVASAATFVLIQQVGTASLRGHLLVGLITGIGFGAAITSVNAIAPNMPRPGLYAIVVGSYHASGLLLASAVLYWSR